jgi:hypothetical protein
MRQSRNKQKLAQSKRITKKQEHRHVAERETMYVLRKKAMPTIPQTTPEIYSTYTLFQGSSNNSTETRCSNM